MYENFPTLEVLPIKLDCMGKGLDDDNDHNDGNKNDDYDSYSTHNHISHASLVISLSFTNMMLFRIF